MRNAINITKLYLKEVA